MEIFTKITNPYSVLYAYRVLSIRSGAVSGLKVTLQKSGENGNLPHIIDSHWSELGGKFKPVCLERIEGKNFANKMELLMSALNQELNWLHEQYVYIVAHYPHT